MYYGIVYTTVTTCHIIPLCHLLITIMITTLRANLNGYSRRNIVYTYKMNRFCKMFMNHHLTPYMTRINNKIILPFIKLCLCKRFHYLQFGCLSNEYIPHSRQIIIFLFSTVLTYLLINLYFVCFINIVIYVNLHETVTMNIR